MTEENRKILDRINAFSEKVLGNIDPQKTPVSQQLEALRPIMQIIADEQGKTLSEIFIMYMDLASEAACDTDRKMKESLQDLNDGSDGLPPLLYR